eukprot:3775673-Prorocentrum_lima.AAC.1
MLLLLLPMLFAMATDWSMSPLNPVASRKVKQSLSVFSIITMSVLPAPAFCNLRNAAHLLHRGD